MSSSTAHRGQFARLCVQYPRGPTPVYNSERVCVEYDVTEMTHDLFVSTQCVDMYSLVHRGRGTLGPRRDPSAPSCSCVLPLDREYLLTRHVDPELGNAFGTFGDRRERDEGLELDGAQAGRFGAHSVPGTRLENRVLGCSLSLETEPIMALSPGG